MAIKHTMRTPIAQDPNRVNAIVNEANDGLKAVPAEIVLKASDDSTFTQINDDNPLPVKMNGEVDLSVDPSNPLPVTGAVQLTGSIVEGDTLRVIVVDGGGSSMRFISGTTDPSADIGMPGDVYLNTSSGDLFKNNNGTWDLQMNLVGPEGPQGPEGKQGPKGDPGEQGPPGVVAADAPITYDSVTQTVGLTPAAFVANADGTDLTTLAASVDALRDALVAAGLMSSN